MRRNCNGISIFALLWRPVFIASVTTAFPSIPDCGSPEVSDSKELISREFEAGDVEIVSLTATGPEDSILFHIETGGARRNRRKTLRGERCGALASFLDNFQKADQEENNDEGLDFEHLIHDCEDEDAEDQVVAIGHSLEGSLGLQVKVEIVDSLGGVLSSKIPFSISNESSGFVMWARGESGQCGRPAALRVTGIEGRGLLQVDSYALRMAGWNDASLTFEDAVDVELPTSSGKGWCGSVNLLVGHDSDPACHPSSNTPKWKVWLNPNEKLLVACELSAREDVAINSAVKVELKIFRASNMNTPEAIPIDTRIVGRQVKRGEFVNNGSASWFFIELFRSRRHLYGYGISFEVERCADEKRGKFVLPENDKTCGWLATQSDANIGQVCQSDKSNANTRCQKTCGECPSCSESPSSTFHVQEHNCKFLQKKKAKLQQKGKFEKYCVPAVAGTKCPHTCEACPSPSSPSLCGLSNHIHGGFDIAAGEYPWFTAITTPRSHSLGCSGALVSDRFVLSAAHCADAPTGLIAIVGYRCSDDDNCGFPHELIPVQFHYRHTKGDFVIFELQYPVSSSMLPKSFAIPNLDGSFVSSFKADDELTLVGGGLTEDTSIYVQKMPVKLVKQKMCRREIRDFVERVWGRMVDGYICSEPACGGSSSGPCRGDSGGALVTKGPDGEDVIVAVHAFGRTFCDVNRTKPDGHYRVDEASDDLRLRICEGSYRAEWCP